MYSEYYGDITVTSLSEWNTVEQVIHDILNIQVHAHDDEDVCDHTVSGTEVYTLFPLFYDIKLMILCACTCVPLTVYTHACVVCA